jgi:hypothetical protein
MSDFLTKLYEEEMEKTGAVELDQFMDQLPASELESILGIDKTAKKSEELKRVKALDKKLSREAEGQARIDKMTSPTRRGIRGGIGGALLGGVAGGIAGGSLRGGPHAGLGMGLGALAGGTAGAISGAQKAKRLRAALEQEKMSKQGVAGSVEGDLPTSAQSAEMDASMQAKHTYLAQEHDGAPKRVQAQPAGAQTSNSMSGASKSSPSKEDEPKTKAAMVRWADDIGRVLAHSAMEKDAGRVGRAGEIVGGVGPAMREFGRGVKRGWKGETKDFKDKDGKEKKSMGDDAQTSEVGEGMENTAAVKAAMVARALRVTHGAPLQVKQAAARVAGRQIAALKEMRGE